VSADLVLDLGLDLALPPRPGQGKVSAERRAVLDGAIANWCHGLILAKEQLDREQPDLRTGPRDWCYLLENHGLHKNDFDDAEKLITKCRKRGLLPLDIVSEDDSRAASNLEELDQISPEEEAESWIDYLSVAHLSYHPISFWENQNHYVEQVAEKMSVVSIFSPVCARFHVPIFPTRGSWDLHSRAGMLRRFAHWQAEGKRCVLQACTDLDVHGLRIANFLRSNLTEMLPAMRLEGVEVDIDQIVIERIGIDADFVRTNKLTWIEGLATGGADMPNLEHPDHPKHFEHDVQSYIAKYGARKVEANALVRVPKAAAALCQKAILRYVDKRRMNEFQQDQDEQQAEMEQAIRRMLRERWSGRR
jgi:hypothetical protein